MCCSGFSRSRVEQHTTLAAVQQRFVEGDASWLYDAIVRTHQGQGWFTNGIARGYSADQIFRIATATEYPRQVVES